MAVMSWSLSGVDAARWRVQSASTWRPPVTVRRNALVVRGRHGSLPTGRPPVFDEANVTLEMLLRGATPSLEAAADELIGLLGAPGLVLGRTVNGLATSAPAELVSVSPGEHDLSGAGVAARFTVNLVIPGAFLREAEQRSAPADIESSPQTVIIPHLANATAPTTDAVLRIQGPHSSVDIRDLITGTGVMWQGDTLLFSQYLFIDVATLKAWRTTTSTDWDNSGGGIDVSSGLSYPGPGLLQIWPRMAASDPAVRQAGVTISGTDFGDATALTVQAAAAHL